MQVKKQQLELVKEQWTGSKLREEYMKTVYCHPAHYKQSVGLDEMQAGIKVTRRNTSNLR